MADDRIATRILTFPTGLVERGLLASTAFLRCSGVLRVRGCRRGFGVFARSAFAVLGFQCGFARSGAGVRLLSRGGRLSRRMMLRGCFCGFLLLFFFLRRFLDARKLAQRFYALLRCLA